MVLSHLAICNTPLLHLPTPAPTSSDRRASLSSCAVQEQCVDATSVPNASAGAIEVVADDQFQEPIDHITAIWVALPSNFFRRAFPVPRGVAPQPCRCKNRTWVSWPLPAIRCGPPPSASRCRVPRVPAPSRRPRPYRFPERGCDCCSRRRSPLDLFVLLLPKSTISKCSTHVQDPARRVSKITVRSARCG